MQSAVAAPQCNKHLDGLCIQGCHASGLLRSVRIFIIIISAVGCPLLDIGFFLEWKGLVCKSHAGPARIGNLSQLDVYHIYACFCMNLEKLMGCLLGFEPMSFA